MTSHIAKPGLSRRSALLALGAGGGFTVLGGRAAARESRADAEAVFTSGVASGDPKRDAVVIWTRATPLEDLAALTVAFEIAEDADFSRVIREGVAWTGADRDWTIKIDIQGLRPGMTLHYRFRAGPVMSPTGRTRTLPADDADAMRIVLASCSNYPSGFFGAYRAIAEIEDLDAVVHVGDYIYEYGPDGYDGETGRRIGRVHQPARNLLTLDDYRARFAQYRADADLQAAHAAAPFITIWDDHETANDSWAGGAANHDPEAEGRWEDRRDAALQAYFEWMPMRDPRAGRAAERLNREYDFGTIATLFVIETRLTGRDRPLSYGRDLPCVENTYDMTDPAAPRFLEAGESALGPVERFPAPFDMSGAEPRRVTDYAEVRRQAEDGLDIGHEHMPDTRAFETVRADPSRTMMGLEQEAWLAEALARSVRRGQAWQVLGNQTVMGRMRAPDYMSLLPAEIVRAAVEADGFARRWLERTRLGLPINLDSWDGYPVARERLYDTSREAEASLVVLSGDSHMFWGNHLHDPRDDALIGVEFGTAGITSPSGYGNLSDDPRIFDIAAEAMTSHNPDISFANVKDRGFVLLTADSETVRADFVRMDDVARPDARPETFLSLRAARHGEGRVGRLEKL
ncbi:alkaline phosphatase [Glycocaulis profundi]|nr:alkaline phosphatase [Glycocaulis profundi]